MSNQDNNYFDLLTTGVGYVNRFRLVKPSNGDPYYSITIAAMRGKANADGKIAKTYIDCNIVGDAVEMAKHIEPLFANEAEPAVMIKFVVGDIELKPFEYQSGNKKGERGYALKGRLFDIKWFKVDGKIFYSEAERLRHEAANDAQSQSDDNGLTDASDDQQPVKQPPVVKVVKDDPYFEERCALLLKQGYVYDRASDLWVLPLRQTA